MCNDFVSVVSMEGRGLEEDTALYVVDVLGANQGALFDIFSATAQQRFGAMRVRACAMQGKTTYHAVENHLPPLFLALLHGLEEQLLVFRRYHLLVDQALIACLIVRLEGKKSPGLGGIHTVDVDFH